MSYAPGIASQINIRVEQASAAIELLDGGNTIPFIARYRKEATFGLDEEQLRQTAELLGKLRVLDERRQVVLNSIDEQGKLTPELRGQIEGVTTMTALEDLYAPYKPRRRTRASIARDHGLQPLADLILQQAALTASLDEVAAPYLSEEVQTIESIWSGARDIVAEWISDHPEIRRGTREKAIQRGVLQAVKDETSADEKRVYELYYEFELRIDRLRPHQILAINRGEAEKVLRVKMVLAERDWLKVVEGVIFPDPRSQLSGQLVLAIADSAERLLLPTIERDIRRMLTESAEAHAIIVFSENLRSLLSQPPLRGQVVLGIDPGFRTGCKLAVVDPTGKLLETSTIYPHEPQRKWDAALQILTSLIARHKVSLITIGNGTASRESEQLAAELTRAHPGLHYLIVNEAGASVYSASPLARAELPDLDVSLRGAVSIARRAQDPLAELVKIDPRSIGVGMYQHDVDQGLLSSALEGVIESVVNAVGVDLNTASPALLSHVAGIGPKLAEKIVAYRDQNGAFRSRSELRMVSGLGPKAFEQSVGFLRIVGGEHPFDASAIHPESYPAAEALLKKAGLPLNSTPNDRKTALAALVREDNYASLAEQLQLGLPTFKDILEQLIRPGRDPRQDLPAPILRSDVLKMEDLAPGMRLKGTVRNVVDFGSFVDIGVKQDGLLHRTQIPLQNTLKVGDVIEVEILKVEPERGRISLGWPGK